MTKAWAWAWACLLLLLVTTSAAVIPSGSLALTSTTSLAPPSSTERSQTPITPLKQRTRVRKYQSSSAEDETRLEAFVGGQQDGPTRNQMRARQQLPPPIGMPLPVATITVVRTVTVEVASQTRIVFQPFEQTLTFINPVVVFETRAVAAPQPFETIAARGKTDTAAFDQESHPVALPAYSPRSKGATLFSRPARVQRQAPVPVPMAPMITVEITTTLTKFAFVRTITAFNQVFVSVTVNQTVTSTRFATTLSAGKTASLPSANPIPLSPERTGSTDTTTLSSTFTSGLESAGTTIFFAPSETSADAGVTTWFSTPSDPGAQRPTESTAASSAEPRPDSAVTAAPSGPTAVTTPEPTSEPALSPGTIASISLGAVTGVLFLLFLGYLYRTYRKYAKNREHHQPSEKDYKMTPPTTATVMTMGRPAVASPNHDGQDGATPGQAGSKSADEAKQIRIVIRPVAKRQSEGGKHTEDSDEVEARRAEWQRASGYMSQGGYSVSVAAGSDSTLRDATGWSNRSEYGSTVRRAASQDGDIPELPALEGAAQMKERH
ncbi:uncharacterized protein LY79DRAFT_296375 [Colletotrichum navitas]|uniref:Transmembrane protein n=1 Tax=Colletotrichum navitas TaxID=681940 RepID=A0AAD8V2E6_9PEZI|nr:uncharacterized protein LY79DRAFT_296375 [Colletotrichum navitas]KAK1580717.1 hypothetical protein LY79DRAFT_296375 [Colletotrichum navitas]